MLHINNFVWIPTLLYISTFAYAGATGGVGTVTLKTTDVGVTSFDSAPNIVLYDDFEGGDTEKSIVMCAKIGCWDEGEAVYSDISYSGKHGMLVYNNNKIYKLKKYFKGTHEIFVSYRVILANKIFPGNVSGPKEFSRNSSWKFIWLHDAVIGQRLNTKITNICLPTWIGRGGFMLAGNDLNVTYLTGLQNYWSWDHWNRFSIWLRANPEEPLASGDVLFQAISKDMGYVNYWDRAPIFDHDGPYPKQFSGLNVPGYIRSGSQSTIVYDDIYIATGPGAVSRVEICDASSYEDATVCEIQLPLKWTESEIIYKASMNGTTYYIDINGDIHSGQ